MVEKNLVVHGLELKYKGVFDLNKLLSKIDSLIAEKGYKRVEKKRREYVMEKGKEFSIELRPVKKKTDYHDLMIKIRINIVNLQDVEIVVDDIKKKMHQGEVDIIFDGFTYTDYKGRWEQTPWYWFVRSMLERIFFQVHTGKYVGELIEDVHYFYNEVRAHLHLHRF